MCRNGPIAEKTVCNCLEISGVCTCRCHGYGGGVVHRAQYSKPLTDREKLAATVASLQPGDRVKATIEGNHPSGTYIIEGSIFLSVISGHPAISGHPTVGDFPFDTPLYPHTLLALEVLSRALPEEPANLSVVLDRFSNAWQRAGIFELGQNAWLFRSGERLPWSDLHGLYGPLTLMVPKS
jgi:hypothetical protein